MTRVKEVEKIYEDRGYKMHTPKVIGYRVLDREAVINMDNVMYMQRAEIDTTEPAFWVTFVGNFSRLLAGKQLEYYFINNTIESLRREAL